MQENISNEAKALANAITSKNEQGELYKDIVLPQQHFVAEQQTIEPYYISGCSFSEQNDLCAADNAESKSVLAKTALAVGAVVAGTLTSVVGAVTSAVVSKCKGAPEKDRERPVQSPKNAATEPQKLNPQQRFDDAAKKLKQAEKKVKKAQKDYNKKNRRSKALYGKESGEKAFEKQMERLAKVNSAKKALDSAKENLKKAQVEYNRAEFNLKHPGRKLKSAGADKNPERENQELNEFIKQFGKKGKKAKKQKAMTLAEMLENDRCKAIV